MSRSRYATHRIRAHYLRTIKALPLPAPSVGPIDPRQLTILGRTRIDQRHIILGTLADHPRLWVAFHDTNTNTNTNTGNDADADADAEPSLIGYMTGLVTGEPDLWVCDDAHRAWAMEGNNTTNLKQAAARVWSDCTRDCEG